jgi:voltage-gated potassium channel Kch
VDPRDDDIEFDFFDEPATTESQPPPTRVRLPRRGGRGTGMRRPAGPPRGLTPIVRLLVAIAILVALFVVFGLLIQSCASTSKHDQYAHYMDAVGKIARGSQDDGAAVANALTSASKTSSIASSLRGIADQEQQNVAQAQKLDPPGPLRPANEQLIEALRLRVSGVNGLARTLEQVVPKKTTGEVTLLSAQADRLVAGDVVWTDLFQGPAVTEMGRQGVKGVAPPASVFIANRQLFSDTSLAYLLQRLRGASTSGKVTGRHGTGIVSTKALPGGQVLSTTTENTVTATTDLAFAVTIEDSGDSQEVNIKVTLTIQQNPAIVKTQTVRVINPNQQKTVTFRNIGQVKFAQRVHVLVDVRPVPGETFTENNRATYPVIFSLG